MPSPWSVPNISSHLLQLSANYLSGVKPSLMTEQQAEDQNIHNFLTQSLPSPKESAAARRFRHPTSTARPPAARQLRYSARLPDSAGSETASSLCDHGRPRSRELGLQIRSWIGRPHRRHHSRVHRRSLVSKIDSVTLHRHVRLGV